MKALRPAHLAALSIVVVAVGLHLAAGYRLPRPWPDESHFITPALTMLRHGRLAVPELNAPQGLFWMPTGHYVVQLPLLALGLDPLVAGRSLSLVGVAVFAVAVASVATRAEVPRYLACLAVVAWLVAPRVVAIGNIARMDGLVLGVTGACVWLLAHDRWWTAVAVALLTPLLHPVGLVVAVAVAAAGALRRRGRPSAGERVLLGVVALLWVAQGAYFLVNADVAWTHLAYQLTRKTGREITVAWWQWLLLAGAAAGGVAATVRWRRGPPVVVALWTGLAVAGGFVIVDVVGREMWYEPLGRETAGLLVAVVAAAALARADRSVRVRRVAAAATAVAVVVVAVVGVRATFNGTWYGMQADAGSRDEWRTFVDAAVGRLRRLDEAATAPATVLVDPLSGFGQQLVAVRWSNLRFVQPTPATPANGLRADYLLTTPGAPFVTRALVEQWAGGSQLEVESTRGNYRLQLTSRG